MIKSIAIIFTYIEVLTFSIYSGQEQFLFSKNISAPGIFSSEIGAFCLDKDIYGSTDDNFADLRIYDSRKNEVPFLIRYVTANDTDTIHYAIDIKMDNSIELPGNRMSLIFTRKKSDSIPSELNISTPLVNFEKSVSVFGSDDKKTWYALAENIPVFDFSQFVDVRNTSVTFEKKSYTYYKITIDNICQIKKSPFSQIVSELKNGTVKNEYSTFIEQQEKFRLDQISFSGYVQNIRRGEPRKCSYQMAIVNSTEDTLNKTSEILLHSNREPIYKLHLSIRESNFKRTAILEGTNDTTTEPQWQQLSASEIYNIKAGTFSRELLEIPLGGNYRFLKYRLKIINNDNLPINVDTVFADGYEHEVLFFHRNNRTVVAFYKCKDSKIPMYDVASVLENAPVINTSFWNVGSQVLNKVEIKKEPLIKSNYILFGSLFLMVAVLIGVLLSVIGKVEKSTAQEDEK